MDGRCAACHGRRCLAVLPNLPRCSRPGRNVHAYYGGEQKKPAEAGLVKTPERFQKLYFSRAPIPFPRGMAVDADTPMGARAAELLLLGEAMSARDALECGLVARVFSEERLREEAFGRCVHLAAKPQVAIRETKRLMRGDLGLLRARMADEARLFGERLGSDEFRDAARAVLEKRGSGQGSGGG